MTQPVLKVFLKDGAKMPVYGRPGDSGLDLRATETVMLDLLTPTKVMTGVHVEIPEGFEGQVRPRSGLSSEGVTVALGTIDRNFRGEIGVTMTLVRVDFAEFLKDGSGPLRREIKAGDKIAQLVIAPVATVRTAQVQSLTELSETARGEQGWGSSGR